MGFHDQAAASAADRKSVFKDGVNTLNMGGKQAIAFRLLPAFNPQDPNPRTSYLPFIDPNGVLTEWGAIIKMCRFVGHGKGGGMRQDILSLKTFEQPRQPRYCPLEALYQAISSDDKTWGYLIDKGDKADKQRQMPPFGRITDHMVANVINTNKPYEGVKLGVFTKSGGAKLIDAKSGLVFMPNPSATPEDIQKNYLASYANGDITCPNMAPVLILDKQENKGDFSEYTVTVAMDPRRGVLRHQIGQELLAQRVNLARWEDYLIIPTEQDTVNTLVQLLAGRSPTGYHEHALLKLTFPQFRVPEPPAAAAATTTIASGFAPAPAQQGFTPVPAPAYTPVPNPTNTVPMPAPVQPQQQPQQGPVGYTQVPQPQTPVPAPQPAVAGEMGGVAANVAAAPAQAPAVAPAAVPGDAVPAFDRNAFLQRVRGGQQ